MSHRVHLVACVALATSLIGCGGPNDNDTSSTAASAVSQPSQTRVVLPPTDVGFDYQLGEPYPIPPGVGIVARDRTAEPADGMYNICYVNGFQTQPGEAAMWLDDHPSLLLTANGAPVTDPGWPDEMILDISTDSNRQALAAIVGEWIDECAADGFAAVEIDNLDSYSRSADLLTIDNAADFAALLTQRAHDAGLAIGQKNSAELLDRATSIGFDFVVVEQCAEYDECQAFVDQYGANVLAIEYNPDAFQRGCQLGAVSRMILRDVLLVATDDDGYVFETCPT